MDIKPKTKLLDLLNEYPELETQVVEMAPPFKNLKNPILRKTVGKLATLEKVAKIGGIDVGVFINDLREEIGLDLMDDPIEDEPGVIPSDAPSWINGDPKHIIDGTAMLDAGEHPLNHINKLMRDIEIGDFVLLKTNFAPLPMHDAMKQQNYVVHYAVNGESHQSFFGK